jgi:EAL and modified HD-GYP domain-containing signal transduction protein
VIARQPIFDTKGNIWGYELLYRRSRAHPHADIQRGAVATANAISNGIEIALQSLRPDQKLLINFPASMIETRVIQLLPSRQCILEILEDVEPTPDVFAALKEIKAAGYLLALDDYAGQQSLIPFLPLADIVKFDVLNRAEGSIAELVNSLGDLPCIRLAEKVEDKRSRKSCQKCGCTLFQGYFFNRPELLPDKSCPASLTERMRIIALLSEEPMNVKALGDAILHMPALAAKLLAFVNSPRFAFKEKVNSVQRALWLMGTTTFTQWLCVTVLASLHRRPFSTELSLLASQRAKFLERLGLALQERNRLPKGIKPQGLFFLGLFSLLEAIARLPLQTVLQGVPLATKIMDALLGKASVYSPWLTMFTAYQRGEWETALALAADYGLEERDLFSAWAFALRWSSEFFSPDSGGASAGQKPAQQKAPSPI